MDKFEYSDLYKFLVSAGIVLIGLAVLLPWFYLKESFDLFVETKKILLLPKEAQIVINGRQSFISDLYTIIPYVSIALILFGVISIVYGLCKWFKKQSDIDVRDLLTTQKLKNEVKDMTSEEVAIKNQNEFTEAANVNSDPDQSTTTTTTIAPTKDEFISNYVQIEQFFINRLTSLYQNKYTIRANVNVLHSEYTRNAQFDLVLGSLSSEKPDVIFEFKYFPKGVLKSTVISLMKDLDHRSLTYTSRVKINIKSILIIVLTDEKFNEARFVSLKNDIELKKLFKEIIFMNRNILVDFINLNQLDNLTAEYFDKLINY